MNQPEHPTEQALVDFMSGSLAAEETWQVVRHLLAGCASCREVTRRHWPSERSAGEEDSVAALELAADDLVGHEDFVGRDRSESEALDRELERHPPSRRLLLVVNSHRFHNWFLAERLVARVVDLGFSEPAQAVEVAELAVALSDRLPEKRYTSALVSDMRARAWGALANARRINSDLSAAGEAFQRAAAFLETGTGDPLEEARILCWRARYLMFRRELTAATRMYDKAIGIYRRLEDAHETGRALIDKGTALNAAGDYARAIEATEQGLESLDEVRDPRMALAARHNLSLYHHRTGDVKRAMSLLREILPLYTQQNDAMVLLRLRWLEGHLAQAQGQNERAEAAYREVQQGFMDRGIPYEAATVSFDLATVLLEERRLDELGDLAAQVLTVFRGLGVPRETVAALELFQGAIEARQLSATWIGELAAFLERARTQPGLVFRPQV